VNRDLLREAAELLSAASWDVALLQECPPRWAAPLAHACRAQAHLTLTSRNWLAFIRGPLARWNPDLMGSWGGGSNLTLTRGAGAAGLRERRELLLRRRPERRKVDFIRLACGLCVSNLHASGPDRLAEADIRRAVDAASTWAGEDPLLFGGDLNLRPRDSMLYRELAEEFGLVGTTSPDAIDHMLSRGLEILEPARAWQEEAREVHVGGRAIRLSDHAPVSARYRLPGHDHGLTARPAIGAARRRDLR
jgi:endonuclease/exonuclease/phosphatase family metal-dependent hydrolase